MNVPAFIARRVAFNRERSFSRFIIRLAIAATVISVGAMLLTLAFTNGFQYAISQKVFNLWGHLRVQHYSPNRGLISEEAPIEKNDTILRILRQDADIKTIQAYATKYAVVRSSESIDYVQLKGVEKDYDFGNLRDFLKAGRWPRFPDSGYSNEIVLSEYTANQLKIKVGDKVVIYFVRNDGPPRIRPMIVSGLFKTGIEDYDKLIAIGDLRLIQRLNNWNPGQIGGYEIFTRDYRQADLVNNRLYDQLPKDWGSITTEEYYPNIFDWLNLQNTTIIIVLIIMIIVATLNLVTCLIILVLERTRMIGILKALGTPNISIQTIFLYQGSIITLFGIVLGNVFGLGVCWLQIRYGFITLPEEAYFISKAVVRLEWWHFALVDGGTFLICFLILMIPTIIVRRMQPVRAIQFR
ncbi:MAG TPA: FtsX-like permease family protein [Puia sp.]|uniref:ABC transporter permease n=1 Tax=Puia sp. TaxID=2045100 RepID=UPI002B5F8AE3|nr:FtsX-like permease family protein [Puia sp.]HVU96693.1 FtsX-like permease family protein [Puia sp.]